MYSNSFTGPFIFDDQTAIESNQSIRHLGAFLQVLSPPIGETVGGRPLVNLTLALNYAVGGLVVWGYHLVNLVIHLAAGLTLFGVLRRTLVRFWGGDESLRLAGCIALVWLVHPMQTESVTYMVQRAESLVSLFYLLTLYAFIRSIDAPHPKWWQCLAILAAAAGMASKEVMASAPLLVLLYDRTFVSGTVRQAWRDRGGWYAGLFATWLILIALMLRGGRGVTAGFGHGVSPWAYALTQSWAVVHYLWLSIWPTPLILDYGTALSAGIGEVFPQLALLLALGVAVTIASWRRQALGVVGVAFFALLAPSSSIVPIATQSIAEHRFYLALAGVITLIVLTLHRFLPRYTIPLVAVWAVVLGGLAWRRNLDYRSELLIWENNVNKLPINARAQENFGRMLVQTGKLDEGRQHLEEALRLDATRNGARNNLGRVLSMQGNLAEAESQFHEAVRRDPSFTDALFNDGTTLARLGKLPEAETEFRAAISHRPAFAGAYAGLGQVYLGMGNLDGARRALHEAVRINPDSLELRVSYGQILAVLRQDSAAVEEFSAALRLNPGLATIHDELGSALAHLNRLEEAITEFETAIRFDPGLTDAVSHLALARRLVRR